MDEQGCAPWEGSAFLKLNRSEPKLGLNPRTHTTRSFMYRADVAVLTLVLSHSFQMNLQVNLRPHIQLNGEKLFEI